jgi:probable HAF family extracellular repeat protein
MLSWLGETLQEETVMKSRILTYMAAISLFAGVVAPVRLGAQKRPASQQPAKYYVFNLGAPLGGNTEPVGINNLGWISGAANLTNNLTSQAEMWVGVALALGTLGGPNSAVEWPNHSTRGEIVGIAETAEANPLGEAWSCSAFFPTVTNQVCLGFAWQDGVMSALPTLGGYDGYAAGVNNRGQVVGWAETAVHDSTCTAPQVLQFEAVIWGPRVNQVTKLTPWSSDPDSAATAINERGQVVGISGICSVAVGGASAEHAVIWENGVPMNMGNIGGQAWNTPVAINNHGQVVGFANTSGDMNAALNPTGFIWTQASGMQPIAPVADGTGDTNDIAFDLNEQEQVVGQSFGPNGARAFLYQNGVATDLNTLVVQGDPNLSLILAQGINDGGEISGTAVDSSTGLEVGFLAVPVFDGSGNTGALRSMAMRSSARKAVSPENIRKQLTGFSRIALEGVGTK